jgi:hypothetical protein
MFRFLMVLIIILFLPVSAPGEIKTVTHTVQQVFGGSQSPDDARIAAVAKAKREALEMAGTYIESTTIVKQSRVDRDEILALSAGVLKAEVVSQKNYLTGEAFGIEVAVKVEVDTSLLEDRVKKMLEDRMYLEQLTDARAREKTLLQRIADLETENLRLKGPARESAGLEKKFNRASQSLAALANLETALAARSAALRDYTRSRQLYENGLFSEAQFLEVKTRYEHAVAAVNEAEASVKAGMAE